jgi:hypothetical protein
MRMLFAYGVGIVMGMVLMHSISVLPPKPVALTHSTPIQSGANAAVWQCLEKLPKTRDPRTCLTLGNVEP